MRSWTRTFNRNYLFGPTTYHAIIPRIKIVAQIHFRKYIVLLQMRSSTFYITTGLGALFYSIFAAAQYYAVSGTQLLSAKESKERLYHKKIQHIIDVRTNAEWSMGHHPKALHIPIQTMEESKLPKDKHEGILVYCNTGQRARAAAEKIKSYGYKNVYYIQGAYTTIQ